MKALKNHKHEGRRKVRNEFLNYGGVLTQTLQNVLKMIFDSDISVDKYIQRKKRGISANYSRK